MSKLETLQQMANKAFNLEHETMKNDNYINELSDKLQNIDINDALNNIITDLKKYQPLLGIYSTEHLLSVKNNNLLCKISEFAKNNGRSIDPLEFKIEYEGTINFKQKSYKVGPICYTDSEGWIYEDEDEYGDEPDLKQVQLNFIENYKCIKGLIEDQFEKSFQVKIRGAEQKLEDQKAKIAYISYQISSIEDSNFTGADKEFDTNYADIPEDEYDEGEELE